MGRLSPTLCFRCLGEGVVWIRGKQVSSEDLTAQQHAELMVNGGWLYEVIPRPCPCVAKRLVVARRSESGDAERVGVLSRLAVQILDRIRL